MKIRYENTIEDFVALARFHNDHSPAARRVRLRATAIVTLCVLAITAGLTVMMSENIDEPGPEGLIATVLMVAILLMALLFALIRLPGGYRRHAERLARRMYAEGANKGLLGARELAIAGNELASRSAYAESKMRLEVIERVVTYEGYTFIFVNAMTAFVIPHGSVTEGDPERFAELIKHKTSSEF